MKRKGYLKMSNYVISSTPYEQFVGSEAHHLVIRVQISIRFASHIKFKPTMKSRSKASLRLGLSFLFNELHQLYAAISTK
ncbi:MAG TPA: hypothetical protein VIR31_04665 [Nitrososphaeraceae archaeon]